MKTLKVILTSTAAIFTLAQPVLAKHIKTHYTTDQCVSTDVVPFSDVGGVLGSVFAFVLIFASLLLFLYFVLGGVQWMTSGGDPKATQAAKDRLTAALVGLLIILSVWGTMRIAEAAFGISIFSGIQFPVDVPSPFKGTKDCV